jgi:hypothetical protein
MPMQFNSVIHALANNSPLENIVFLLAQEISHPLLVMDASFHYLACSTKERLEDEIWDDFLGGVSKEQAYPDVAYTIYLMMEVMNSSEPILSDFQGQRQKRVVGKIFSGSLTLGYYVCLSNGIAFEKDYVNTFSILSSLLSIALLRHVHQIGEPVLPGQKVLKKLLSKEKSVQDYSSSILSSLFLKESEDVYQLLYIPLAQSMIDTGTWQHACAQIEGLLAHPVSLLYESALVIFFSCSKEEGLLKENILSILKAYSLHGVLSLSFHNLSYLYSAYLQAKKAAFFYTSKPLEDYESLLFTDLIHTLNKDEAERFLHPDVFVLYGLEEKKRKEVLLTLKTYLECAGSITRTAQKLYTHRNTIVYRLDSLQQLLTSDLKNGTYCIHLYLSLLLYESIFEKEQDI